MKRFLAVLICIFMLVSLLPAFAFAQEGAGDDPAAMQGGVDGGNNEGTVEPTPVPSAEPTPAPSAEPTPAPSAEPTPTPAADPTPTPAAKLQMVKSNGQTDNSEGGEGDEGGAEPPVTYTVTVSASPVEGGTASGGGTYETGTNITVTATANDGYAFVKWTKSGSDVSTNASYTFTVTENCELIAVFAQSTGVQPTDDGGGENGEQNGGGTGDPNGGSTVSITPASADVPKGGTLQFSLKNAPEGTSVTWSISGSNLDSDTTISEGGLLTVASDETAAHITVTATWGTDGGQSATATVNVTDPAASNAALDKIEITTQPTKTEYTAGETFDPTGMVVTATYSDNTTKEVTGYTYPTEALAAGTNSVTISYTEGEVTKTATQSITVKAATMQSATSLSSSHSKVSRGKIVTFTAVVKDHSGQPIFKANTKLYINGKLYDVAPVDGGGKMVWKIHAAESNGFVIGENTITAKYPGSYTESPSEASVKLIVTKACNPRPVCKPTHYCCGQNHFTGKCVTVRSGEDVTFKVDLGCNESCQWYIDKGDGCGFVKIKGATCPTFTVKDVTHRQDGYRYRCVIRNCCETVRTPIYTLNVASGQLYTPKTGDSSGTGLGMAIAAIGLCLLTVRRRAARS